MEKMIRKQENPAWPTIIEARVITVSGKKFGDPMRYVLDGIGTDAKSLCPTNSYTTKKRLIAAAQKMGWKIK